MTDLKLIDELLCGIKARYGMTWRQIEDDPFVTGDAMDRLRVAWKNGEMEEITLSLANYFDDMKHQNRERGPATQGAKVRRVKSVPDIPGNRGASDSGGGKTSGDRPAAPFKGGE